MNGAALALIATLAAVIPSERSESAVIPSERSESRDLHLGSTRAAKASTAGISRGGAEGGALACYEPADAEARSRVQRSLRRTLKDFDLVDGEERCNGAPTTTRRAVRRASADLRASA
jgi:hypothetical protein